MIPNVLHYVWYGTRDKPEIFHTRVLPSWKRHYDQKSMVLWNEDNSPINEIPELKKALDTGKYGLASDIMRYYILVNHGGFYHDVDSEIVKPFDSLLDNAGVCGQFDKSFFDTVGTGMLGSEPGNPLFRDQYVETIQSQQNITVSTQAKSIQILSSVCKKYGITGGNCFQKTKHITKYPCDTFFPIHWTDVSKKEMAKTGMLNIAEDTFTIHHYTISWMNRKNNSCHTSQTSH